MSEQTTIPREMPKWACLSVILFSCVAIGAQGAVDIYQGAKNTVFLSPEWVLQAYSMTLPTMGAVAFSLFCGWLLNIGHRTLASMIFVVAAGFMVVTTSNGWDFMAAQTIGKDQAIRQQDKITKEVADIQNEQVIKERNQAVEELWRTYTTTRSQEQKDKAFSQWKGLTQAPVGLQTTPVNAVGGSSGEIFHRNWGWRPEAIQELRALGLPALIMIAKMFGLTLGFGFWPRGYQSNLNPSSPEDTDTENPRENGVVVDLKPKTERWPKKLARADLNTLLIEGGEIPSQVILALRYGVSETTINTWLSEWPEFHRLPAETGRRNRIVLAHRTNGNGRLLTQ